PCCRGCNNGPRARYGPWRGCAARRPRRRWCRCRRSARSSARRSRQAPRTQGKAAVSRAHLFQRNAPCAAPRAVGHIAGKLTAGSRDAVAAGFARGHRQAGALQDLGEAPDPLRTRTAESGMREGIERNQVELAAHMARDSYQLARLHVRVVYALEHDVLESDEVARRFLEVAVARSKQLAKRVFEVNGDQLI